MNTQQNTHKPTIYNSDAVIFETVKMARRAEQYIKSRAKVTMTVVVKIDGEGWIVDYFTNDIGWATLRMEEWEAFR